MEGLLEFIFANFFLFFIILAGLFSFLRSMLANQNKQGSPQKDKQEGSTLRDVMKRFEEMVETFENPEQSTTRRTISQAENEAKNESPIQETTATIQEQIERNYEGQYARLQEQYQTMSNTTNLAQNPSTNDSIQLEINKSESEKLTVDLQSKLNREGLIESIVMAEVLGPPRARRSHHRILNR